MENLVQAGRLRDALGDIFCLTIIRGVGAAEALLRMGAYPETFNQLHPSDMDIQQLSFEAGYPRLAGAVALGEWTAVLEPSGFQCAGTLLAEVSRGTEAVSVLRHDYAHPHFAYALDGTELTAFDPEWTDRIWGAEPGRLRTHLRTAGLDPVDPDDDVDGAGEAVARAVLLAALVAGVMPSLEALTGPMLAAEFEPWFTGAAPAGSALWADPAPRSPSWNPLVEAIASATPAAKRAAAVAEARRIAGLAGVTDAPGLAEVLADAEAGRFPAAAMASPLGREVRAWLRLSSTTSWSLNDSAAPQQTETERARGNLFGWLAGVLRAALHPDPDLAVRTALYPLGSGLSLVADPGAHTAALSLLRS